MLKFNLPLGRSGRTVRVKPEPLSIWPTFKDLTGDRIGKLTVLFYVGRCGTKEHWWYCQCECGRVKLICSTGLASGRVTTCTLCKHPAEKPDTKACRKCGIVYPFTEEFFFANCQHPFGLRARCRKCVNDQIRGLERERVKQVRLSVLQHYSQAEVPFCACCGESHLNFLAIDHIYGGGCKHYLERRKSSMYNWLKARNNPPGYQVLCHNCNSSLGRYGYCPHQPEKKRPVITKSRSAMPKPQDDFSGAWQTCNHCNQHYPLTKDYFYANKQMPSGYIKQCKDCNLKSCNPGHVLNRLKTRLLVIAHYSNNTNTCECCGAAHMEFLAIDHINGGGAKHRKSINGSFYRHLVKENFPTGFRVLCHNCNQSAGFYGRCPHKQA